MKAGGIQPPPEIDDFHHVLLWGITVGGQDAVRMIVRQGKGKPHRDLASVSAYTVPSPAMVATLIVAGMRRPPDLAGVLSRVGRSADPEPELGPSLQQVQKAMRNAVSRVLTDGGSIRSLRPDHLDALFLGAELPDEVCSCIREAHDQAVASGLVLPLDVEVLRAAITTTVVDLETEAATKAVVSRLADIVPAPSSTDICVAPSRSTTGALIVPSDSAGRAHELLARLRTQLDVVQTLTDERRLTEDDRSRVVARLLERTLFEDSDNE